MNKEKLSMSESIASNSHDHDHDYRHHSSHDHDHSQDDGLAYFAHKYVVPPAKYYIDKVLKRQDLGDNIPNRGGVIKPTIASAFLKALGWTIKGDIPNVKKAVFLALPHTSYWDGVYAIPCIIALDLDVKVLGKQSLFKNFASKAFFNWVGVIPIDRANKGSVLKATIDKFNERTSLFLGLSPEGTRSYAEKWKSGFYHIARAADVPIVPVAMDYATREIRFMHKVEPTDNYEADLARILNMYRGVLPKHPENMSQPLQDVNGIYD